MNSDSTRTRLGYPDPVGGQGGKAERQRQRHQERLAAGQGMHRAGFIAHVLIDYHQSQSVLDPL